MVRSPRRILHKSVKLRVKQQSAAALYMERYLQQQYESINLPIVKSNCSSFDPKNNPMCRSCQFFSERKHVEKFGKICSIWQKVFGPVLHKALIDLAKSGITIDAKFVKLWNARNVAPAALPKGVEMVHSADYQTRKRMKNAERLTGAGIINCVVVE